MTGKRIAKSMRLPKYGAFERKIMVEILQDTLPYKESINRGLPFFTLKEIKKIEEDYKDGMTWKDIDNELSKKGLIVKKATFRRYIKDKNISSAIGYRKYKKGREALYPSDTVEHINFIQYFFRIADHQIISTLIDIVSKAKVSALDVIKSKLTENNLFTTVVDNSTGLYHGDDDIEKIIDEVFEHDPNFREMVLAGYREIAKCINDKYNQWEAMLAGYEFQLLNTTDE